MLPTFPENKPLELNDYKIITKLSGQFKPYSDFNFISLWAWNTDNSTTISELNGNLVIDLRSYIGSQRVISFLGNNQVSQTLDCLLRFARERSKYIIELIPQSSVESILDKDLMVESRDDFDYIYKVQTWVEMQGPKFQNKRNKYRRFQAEYGERCIFRVLDSNKLQFVSEILDLINQWRKEKESTTKQFDEIEFTAIERLIETPPLKNLVYFGVYVDNSLAGFAAIELVGEYALEHFEKTDHQYVGITEFLRKNCALSLSKMGIKYFNAEQDLGIEALRRTKESWDPSDFLKKYTIKLK